MDAIAQDLFDFLIRIHQNPETVSEKMEHYMKHVLFLLPPDEENIIFSFFGVFGKPVTSLAELASKYSMSNEDMQRVIDRSLRRLAITPEWQMLKDLIK